MYVIHESKIKSRGMCRGCVAMVVNFGPLFLPGIEREDEEDRHANNEPNPE